MNPSLTFAGFRRLFANHFPQSIAMPSVLVVAATVSQFVVAHPVNANPDNRPNVVVIMADDMGYEALRCNGSTFDTPHLDQLATSGARFTRCHSTPLCTPSRVLIMTGRYGFRNYRSFGVLDPAERTFGHMFQAAGYATALAGKWQLGSAGGPGTNPARAGFDEYIVWNYTGTPGQTGERYADPTLITFDRHSKTEQLVRRPDGYGPDLCAEYLLDFIARNARSGKPFFAWYPMILTHDPFVPTPHSREWESPAMRSKRDNKHFKEMVEYADHLVGRVIGTLDDLGVRETTLVIFTGDNGTHQRIVTPQQDGTQIRGGKGDSKSTGTHVPLIVNWPGVVKPGQVTEQVVDFSDVLPTLAQATGVKPLRPAGDGVLDGQSFLPAVAEAFDGPLRKTIVNYYVEERQNNFGWPKSIFASDGRYKFYGYYERTAAKSKRVESVKTGELFDTHTDPEERQPLTGAAWDSRRKQLQAVLDGLRLRP